MSFLFCFHLDGEREKEREREREMVAFDCLPVVLRAHSDVGWSAVCDCFLNILNYFFLEQNNA